MQRTVTAPLGRDPKLDRSLEWLKRVAGVDDEYISRWSDIEWREWQRAMETDRADPCPSVPEWMRPLIPQWHWDFSLPWPCVAQLWPTGHDWFVEAARRGDFDLVVEEPDEGWVPQLAALEDAWRFAVGCGLTPHLAMNVLPTVRTVAGSTRVDGVTGCVEAFYVTTPLGSAADAIDRLQGLLGHVAAEPTGPLRGEPYLAWEWLYG